MADVRIREALLYESTGDGVRCRTCERLCLIAEGKTGFCGTRKNSGGKLFTLVYGDISSMSANPIEKKPLFHFYPGTRALTIGTWSCNFNCPWCQNYDISKSRERIGRGQYVSPEAFVRLVQKNGCQGTSVSLNEPTLLLEYSLDVFALARRAGYYNTFVSNGYMTVAALDALIDGGLDAMNIDIKGEADVVKKYCGADVELVWRNAVHAKNKGVWVELTTLVIPGVNDDDGGLRRMARRIRADLGDETPWHVTGYYPAYEFALSSAAPATPVHTLEKARDIGREEGLKYVYAGNVPGHRYENTYCPECGLLLIERQGFNVRWYRITADKRCRGCGTSIPIIGQAFPGCCA
ncbi:MAG: AmmeMemoRadiSam system radical SAM enzyme [Dehalococcoidia bacterium]|nr:AmmeMemoRadiSam system radical SAM enzyme [Dehalococcoidia bacterium]